MASFGLEFFQGTQRNVPPNALCTDGRVVTWGSQRGGGDCGRVKERLKDVQQIQAMGWMEVRLDGFDVGDLMEPHQKQTLCKYPGEQVAWCFAIVDSLYQNAVVCCSSGSDALQLCCN